MSCVAQATKQKVEITQAASIALAHDLVQVGVADICYARSILPDTSFQRVKIGGIEEVDAKMVRSDHNTSYETQMISTWMTNSVRDALESGYATKFIFGLAADPECRSILEEYVFYFEHDEQGNILVGGLKDGRRTRPLHHHHKNNNNNNNNNRQQSSNKPPTINTARRQVSKLLRAIITVTSTLDPIPGERYVFCKMEFSDDCPEDYQPPGFVDAGDRAVGFFAHKPFTLRLGSLTTPFHNVTLGVRSILDSVDVDRLAWGHDSGGGADGDGGGVGDNVSTWDEDDDDKEETTMMQGRDTGGVLTSSYREQIADLFTQSQPDGGCGNEDVVAHGLRQLNMNVDMHGDAGADPSQSRAGGIFSVAGSERTMSVAVGPETKKKNNGGGGRTKRRALDDGDDDEDAGTQENANVWHGTQVSGQVMHVSGTETADEKKRVTTTKRQRVKTSIVEKSVHQKNPPGDDGVVTRAGMRSKEPTVSVSVSGADANMHVDAKKEKKGGRGHRQRRHLGGGRNKRASVENKNNDDYVYYA